MTVGVSVVMPAYNAADTIGAALASVLWQSYEDIEVVVVDDGSTDKTAAIAASFEGPVRIIRQPNAGVAAARNRGVAAAQAELVTFCDADDILFEKHVEALLAVWRQTGGGIATANAYFLLPGGIDRRKTRHKGRFPRPGKQRLAILHQNFVSTMSLFPRSLWGEIGPFDENLPRAEDWDFWIRAIYAGRRVSHQPQPLALYRWGATGLSVDQDRFHDADRDVLAKVAARVDLTRQEREYVMLRLSSPAPRQLAVAADAAIREGRYRAAARLYRQAAGLVPTETMLRRKARLMRVIPWVAGPLLRSRQQRIEGRLGLDERRFR